MTDEFGAQVVRIWERMEAVQAEWPSPGGLSYYAFRRLVLFHSTPKKFWKYRLPNGDYDLGKGHVAVRFHWLPAIYSGRDKLPAEDALRIAQSVVDAIAQRDIHFFEDAQEALFSNLRGYLVKGFTPTDLNRRAIVVLETILERPQSAYRIVDLQRVIEARGIPVKRQNLEILVKTEMGIKTSSYKSDALPGNA